MERTEKGLMILKKEDSLRSGQKAILTHKMQKNGVMKYGVVIESSWGGHILDEREQ